MFHVKQTLFFYFHLCFTWNSKYCCFTVLNVKQWVLKSSTWNIFATKRIKQFITFSLKKCVCWGKIQEKSPAKNLSPFCLRALKWQFFERKFWVCFCYIFCKLLILNSKWSCIIGRTLFYIIKILVWQIIEINSCAIILSFYYN